MSNLSLQSLGDVSWDTWREILKEADSPILEEGSLAYDAAKPHTAVCLATLKNTSAYGLSGLPTEYHNPFNIKSTGSFAGYVEFSTYVEAITHWKQDYFPDQNIYDTSLLWSIVRDTEYFLSLESKRFYENEVEGYLDSDGSPTESTLLRWWGDTPPMSQKIFDLWKRVGQDTGLYPPVYSTCVVGNGLEVLFVNGLRIYEDYTTHRLRIFGSTL